jgi:membrane dipeptidase
LIPLFDLHCDTLYELYKRNENIQENSLHISLNKLKCFSRLVQIGAIWSDNKLSNDEAYESCLQAIKCTKNQNIAILDALSLHNKYSFILAVEDARLLNGHIERLDLLYSLGIRVITLNWKDQTCIGGGWNTDYGLTEFGKSVVQRSCELGIVVDLSHSSVQGFWNALECCQNLGKPPIASHSNAYSICNHRRNLDDSQIKALCLANSLIGVSLVPEHLGENANMDTIISHIEHLLSLGCENCTSLGCDFDGTFSLPRGINSIEDLPMLYFRLKNEFGKEIAKKIFFDNAYDFFKKHLRKEL